MLEAEILEHIRQAVAERRSLQIVGGNSKAFYGGVNRADAVLDVSGYQGVIDYQPSELVITARAGSRLHDIETLLAGSGQMLAFEPPRFAGNATLGGTLACGFSGPRRAFAGSARDFMLGCKIVNGRGEVLNFGGRVMKNVAGFDVSRLMVGAMGTLGLMLEVSLRVMALPEAEMTLRYEMSPRQAISKMNVLAGQAWPLSGLSYDGERLYLRLSGAQSALSAVFRQLGGERDQHGGVFWYALREQQLAFFQQPGELWRISVAPAEPPLNLSGSWLLDWGGALRWLKTELPAGVIHAEAERAGGYAVGYRGADKFAWFRLVPGLAALQQNLRTAFDPYSLFNPGRLWP